MNSYQSDQIITSDKKAHESGVTATIQAQFSPDGKYLALIGSAPEDIAKLKLCVYDTTTWRMLHTTYFDDVGLSVNEAGLSFSPDSSHLAFGVKNVFILRVFDWSILRTIKGPYNQGSYAAGGVQALTFSPNGEQLSVLYKSVFWPMKQEVKTSEDAAALERAALLSVRANQIPNVTRQAVIMTFKYATGEIIFSTRISDGNSDGGRSLATGQIVYSPDGAKIAVAGKSFRSKGHGIPPLTDIFIAFYSSRDGKFLNPIINAHTDLITYMAFSRNGSTFFTGTNSGNDALIYDKDINSLRNQIVQDGIRQWDVHSGAKISEFGHIKGTVRNIYAYDDDKTLLVCHNSIGSGDLVSKYDYRIGHEINSYGDGHNNKNAFAACAVSPDGRSVLVPELRQTIGGGARPDMLNVIPIR